MAVINNQGIQRVTSGNQVVPNCKGPLSLKVLLDFSANAQYDLDLSLIQSLKEFDQCQTIFVDNRTGANVEIDLGISGQHITAKANTQGYYNVIMPVPSSVTFTSPGGGGVVTAFLLNVPVPGFVWPTV